MVGKIIQWVPIDGTRWRNEVANGHENHGVGVHYFASYQLPMDFVVCGGAFVGVLALFLIKHEIETRTDPTPRGESL